jgi:hypothetical protein
MHAILPRTFRQGGQHIRQLGIISQTVNCSETSSADGVTLTAPAGTACG